MTGDERVRMCGQCNKHVFSLSNMTRVEAEQLIIEKNGNLCVRYYQRKDGTILLKDCEVAASAARKRQMLGAAAAAMLATAGGFAALTMHRSGSMPEAARIVQPAPPAEIDWRVHDQQLTQDDPPPPPPPEVPTAPQEVMGTPPRHYEDIQVTGGAIAITPDEVFK